MKPNTFMVGVAAVFVVLAFAASPALAIRGHVFAGAFDGKTPGSGQFEKFEDPSGIAVNEASGEVYVLDEGKVRVERFDEGGSAFESSFNGGETPAKSFSDPEAIAIDNGCSLREQRGGGSFTQGQCEALDPSDGDVYVVDTGHGVIDKFTASGEYLTQLVGTCPAPGETQSCAHRTPFGALYGVTVGEGGTVWVASAGPHGEGLLSSFNDLSLNRFEGSVALAAVEAGASERAGLAVNAQGDAYESFAYPLEAEAFVAELGPGGGVLDSWVDGQPLHEPVPGTAPPGLAVEPASGQVYVDDTTSLARYAPDGALIERLGEGELTGAGSVAVDQRSETVYVVDSVAGTVSVFAPEAVGAPIVAGERPVEVGATNAGLRAQVDSRGAGASYYFEYGRCATLAGCSGAGYEASAPATPATLGADFETHVVSVPVEGLQPDSAYHYRVVAENDAGGSVRTVTGAEQTFTTQAPGGKLVLPDGREWELVSPVDKHGAVVGVGGVARSSADGQSVVYPASAPTEAGVGGGGVLIVSQRGGEAWASHDVDAVGGEAVLLEAFTAGGCSGCAVSGVEDAEALGALGVLGTSEDGSYVYFVANGVLTGGEVDSAGEHAVQGACQTTGLTRRPQLCNLYEQHMGASGWEAPRLVAVLSSADFPDWSAQLEHHTARVAPDGEWVAFMSQRSLTGYDNEDVTSAKPGERLDEEVYLYRTGASVVCASCNPTGMRPAGVQYGQIEASHGGLAGGEGVWPSSAWIAGSVPGWESYEPGGPVYQPRYLSNGGRLFFDSSDELVSQDSNSSEDVYEYEPAGYTSAQGESDCASADTSYSETAKGCIALISSGVSSGEAVFLDASESGGDVFFLTSAKLVPQDTDTDYDVYDAHECTAGAQCYSEAATQTPQCVTADACRPVLGAASQPAGALGSTAPGPAGGASASVSPPRQEVLGAKAAAPPQPTRAQQLAAALARCHKQRTKTKRLACERAARAKYGTKKTSSSHTKTTKKDGKGGSR